MRVLVACEYSGRVRDAFIANGHEALSVDLLPTDQPGPHFQGDVFDVIDDGWDLMVAHPPCTYLTGSGARWLYLPQTPEEATAGLPKQRDEARWADLAAGAEFFRRLGAARIPRIALENPVMMGHATKLHGLGRATQFVQPWQFGHGETKRTGLWLKNLPPLVPTNIVEGREGRIHKLPPSPDRWKLRSTTFQGIADAMGSQWGALSPLDQEESPTLF